MTVPEERKADLAETPPNPRHPEKVTHSVPVTSDPLAYLTTPDIHPLQQAQPAEHLAWSLGGLAGGGGRDPLEPSL